MEWSLPQFEALHKSYFKTRHTANTTNIGRLLEAAFSLYLAEVNRVAGNEARSRELIAFAVDSHPAHVGLRSYEASSSSTDLVEIDWAKILLPPKSKKEEPLAEAGPKRSPDKWS
jgi:hypothetical protein